MGQPLAAMHGRLLDLSIHDLPWLREASAVPNLALLQFPLSRGMFILRRGCLRLDLSGRSSSSLSGRYRMNLSGVSTRFAAVLVLFATLAASMAATAVGPIGGTCISCSGRGRVICMSCQGSGRGMKCFQCDGTGAKLRSCTMCNGTGRAPGGNLQCFTCRGTGAKLERCISCGGAGASQCFSCRGVGIKTCTMCSGSGRSPFGSAEEAVGATSPAGAKD